MHESLNHFSSSPI